MGRAQAEHKHVDIHAAYLLALAFSQVQVLAFSPKQYQEQFKYSRRQGPLH